ARARTRQRDRRGAREHGGVNLRAALEQTPATVIPTGGAREREDPWLTRMSTRARRGRRARDASATTVGLVALRHRRSRLRWMLPSGGGAAKNTEEEAPEPRRGGRVWARPVTPSVGGGQRPAVAGEVSLEAARERLVEQVAEDLSALWRGMREIASREPL